MAVHSLNGDNHRIPVYDGETIVARVKYNNNLDLWDGSNWCRGTGRHLGLTRLKDGRFVLIHGSDWQGERDYAEIISDEEALQQILQARNDELLEKYFPEEAEEIDEMEEEE